MYRCIAYNIIPHKISDLPCVNSVYHFQIELFRARLYITGASNVHRIQILFDDVSYEEPIITRRNS